MQNDANIAAPPPHTNGIAPLAHGPISRRLLVLAPPVKVGGTGTPAVLAFALAAAAMVALSLVLVLGLVYVCVSGSWKVLWVLVCCFVAALSCVRLCLLGV